MGQPNGTNSHAQEKETQLNRIQDFTGFAQEGQLEDSIKFFTGGLQRTVWVLIRDAYAKDQKWKNGAIKVNCGITNMSKQRGKGDKRVQLGVHFPDRLLRFITTIYPVFSLNPISDWLL